MGEIIFVAVALFFFFKQSVLGNYRKFIDHMDTHVSKRIDELVSDIKMH